MGTRMNAGDLVDRFDSELDLRRKRSGTLSDLLVRRAHWLDAEDRELVLAIFERGQSAAAIGTLTSTPARQIRRRIRQLVARLNDPRVAYVVAHKNSWGRTMQAVGRELFIRGRTMRQVSDTLGITLHSVRKHRDAIETMSATERQRHRPSRVWLNAERAES